jgi:hypothetical protein
MPEPKWPKLQSYYDRAKAVALWIAPPSSETYKELIERMVQLQIESAEQAVKEEDAKQPPPPPERPTTEVIRAIRASRTPMSLRVLPQRPAAWAGLAIAAANYLASRTPQTTHGAVAGASIFVGAAFVVFWSARVRRDWKEYDRKKREERERSD